jgi:hypothetical protein
MGQTASNVFINCTLTGPIITKHLADEHRQRLSGWVASLTVTRKVLFNGIEEPVIGE